MPAYDVSATYSMHVAAPPSRVWQEVMNADFSQMPVARRLMALRTLGRKQPPPGEPRTLANMGSRGGGGFLEIARVPEQEIVLGIIGKFWRPDAPVLRDWKRSLPLLLDSHRLLLRPDPQRNAADDQVQQRSPANGLMG